MYIDKEEQRYIEFKGKRSRHLNYLPNTPRPYLNETYITSDTSTAQNLKTLSKNRWRRDNAHHVHKHLTIVCKYQKDYPTEPNPNPICIYSRYFFFELKNRPFQISSESQNHTPIKWPSGQINFRLNPERCLLPNMRTNKRLQKAQIRREFVGKRR